MMKNFLLLFSFFFIAIANRAIAQVIPTPAPFSGCPNVNLAVARAGTNTYANEPVNIYNVDIATGNLSIIPGGGILDPSNTSKNLDFNAAGLNTSDGFVYGMNSSATPTPNFYRLGSNYGIQQVGVIAAPTAMLPSNFGFVNSAAGEFDKAGNYYFTGATGVATIFPSASFTPKDFYIGKITNVSSLLPGTSTITPTYTKLDLSAANCSNYFTNITSTVASLSTANSGLKDLVYSQADGQLYSYVTFENPIGSGTFVGQLLSVNPTTGVVTCYPTNTDASPSASNEVAGMLISTSGDIEILFTNGNIYKAVVSSPLVYTGNISLLSATSLSPGPIRGDLAGCGAAVLPIELINFNVQNKLGKAYINWTTATEQNNKGFTIQRSTNAINWVNVNFVPSKAQGGNSNSLLNYVFIDNATLDGVLYYRLKQTDLDGKNSFSNVQKIVFDQSNLYSIINPVVNELKINFYLPQNIKNIKIVSTDGKVVYQNFVAQYNIPVYNLANGLYYIMATDVAGKTQVQKFLKQNL